MAVSKVALRHLGGMLLSVWVGLAWGGDACVPLRPDLDEMLANESRCLSSPDFLQALGHLLNTAGRYAEALDRLEAAIMLDPSRWAAHLEYALALEGAGDEVSATALITQLSKDSTVDPEIRRELGKIRQRMTEGRWGGNPPRTTVGFSVGYDDNLLGATRYSNLQLTLPDGNLPVTLDASEQPKPGSFVRFEFSHEHDLYQNTNARWRAVALGSYRRGVETDQADLGHLALGVQRNSMALTGGYLSILTQQLYRAGQQALWQTQLGGGVEHVTQQGGESACRLRAGGEWYMTRYPDNAILNGRYSGLLLQALCDRAGWLMQLRLGEDRPNDAARPGGIQQQHALRLGYQNPVAGGWLSGEYEFYQQKDRKGYSALLENNARRDIKRHIWRLEYRWPYAGLMPYVGFELLDQRANLALFSPRNAIVTLGVRHAW